MFNDVIIVSNVKAPTTFTILQHVNCLINEEVDVCTYFVLGSFKHGVDILETAASFKVFDGIIQPKLLEK